MRTNIGNYSECGGQDVISLTSEMRSDSAFCSRLKLHIMMKLDHHHCGRNTERYGASKVLEDNESDWKHITVQAPSRSLCKNMMQSVMDQSGSNLLILHFKSTRQCVSFSNMLYHTTRCLFVPYAMLASGRCGFPQVLRTIQLMRKRFSSAMRSRLSPNARVEPWLRCKSFKDKRLTTQSYR